MGAAIRHRVSLFFVLTAFLSFVSGPASAKNIIERVNEDNKRFSGVWVHKIRTPGQAIYSVITRVKIEVSGRRFHLRYVDGGEREFIYDGEALYLLHPSRKEAARFEMEEFGPMPFWKMPVDAEPLLRTMFAGEEEVAGRVCYVFRGDGDYPQGEVSVIYWVDKQTDLLLKKEYVLIIGDEVFVRESYESEEVELNNAIPEEEFKVSLSGDWKEVQDRRPDLDILETKF